MLDINYRHYNLPGMMISVSQSNSEITHHCAGLSDVSQGIKVQPSHLIQLGRIMRLLTTATVLRLRSQTNLDIDAPLGVVADHHQLDNGRLRIIVNQYPFLKPITVRELLSQTSGIPAFDQTHSYERDFLKKPQKVWQAEAYLDLISAYNVSYRVGYQLPVRGFVSDSKTNFILVGLVLEAVTGQRSSTVLQEMFNLANLKNTRYCSYGVVDLDDFPAAMHGYLPISHPYAEAFSRLPVLNYNDSRELQVYDVTSAYNYNGLCGSAAFSTTTDLLTWFRLLLQGKIISHDALKEVFDFQPVSLNTLSTGSKDFYGLGIYKSVTKRYGELLWSAGNNLGYGVLLVYSLEQDTAFVLATNINWQTISLHSYGLVADCLPKIFHK